MGRWLTVLLEFIKLTMFFFMGYTLIVVSEVCDPTCKTIHIGYLHAINYLNFLQLVTDFVSNVVG